MQTQSPFPQDWHSFLENLQDVCVAPCRGPGFRGIPEMPGRAGSLAAYGSSGCCPHCPELCAAEEVGPSYFI